MPKDAKPPVTRDSDKFMLRLPDGMRDRIAELAKKNNRSMNSEIIARLEQSIDEDTQPKIMLIDELENLLHGVLDRINDKKSRNPK